VSLLGPFTRPRADLTPGDYGTATVARHVTLSTKIKVFRSYGIPVYRWHLYTIDHLVPLELGGTNDIRNLWPQPSAEARSKDADENMFSHFVAIGHYTLAKAQQMILKNWGPQ
jgi:hypothetical protein